jgi:(E)-4-hydroxy-3-methylbut-2-enyl-diphosphate synthase
MVYAAGKTDHTIEAERMLDHVVELVEQKAAALQAEAAAAKEAALAAE